MSIQSADSLTMKEYPIMFWIMGAIFLLVGAGITTGALEGGGVTLLIGVIFMGVGLLFTLLIASITTIQADRAAGMLSIYSWSLLRRSVKEIPIGDLAGVEIQSSHSSDGNTYRISFRTKSGECSPLHSYYSSGYQAKEKKAQKISEFLGVPGPSNMSSPMEAIGAMLHPTFEEQQSGESSGIHWVIEKSMNGTLPVTRWSSPDFRFEGSFLLLTQIPQGAINLTGPKWLGGISSFLYRQVLRMYGFSEEELPGIDTARPFDLPKPGLGDHFNTLTNDSYGAQQLVTPWVGNLLLDWVRRFPVLKTQSSESAMAGQLAVLFSPQKLYLVSFLASSPEIVDEMVRLGTGLIKEAGKA